MIEIDGQVVSLCNPDVKIRTLQSKVKQLEIEKKALESQIAEEKTHADEQREEIRKLRGKLMSDTRRSNAAIKKREEARLRKAQQQQAETQLSPN
jgi:predicted  nucleic acid-binding Zn-ribbon protein